jgi:polar amino acid transport system substrate-binding protein
MWRIILFSIAFFITTSASSEQLFITTEEYPPYNTRGTDGQPRGVYMDQLKIIFARAQVDYDATVTPWARAIALAESKPMHCVVAAARTPEREAQFKWVSPVHTDRNVLVGLRERHLKIKNLDEAKDYLIGTQRNDYTQSVLKSLGFTHIDLSADFDKTLSKLAAGRIDLMPMSESALRKLPGASFQEVVVLTHQSLGMACNRSVPDELISRMQLTLDALIADGTQRKIYEKYGLVIRQ